MGKVGNTSLCSGPIDLTWIAPIAWSGLRGSDQRHDACARMMHGKLKVLRGEPQAFDPSGTFVYFAI